MKIDGSAIAMSSAHLLESRNELKEELHIWLHQPPPPVAKGQSATQHKPSHTPSVRNAQKEVEGNPKLFLMKKIIEAFTGRKIKNLEAEDLGDRSAAEKELSRTERLKNPESPERAGWGLAYEFHEVETEIEEVAFSAQGVVKTADGREISFQLDLRMRIEIREEKHFSLRAGDAAIDPLVVNFGGHSAELSDQRFTFDLDGDGQEEMIPWVAGGSGFLAFDRNGDRAINNGTELFGPRTGNGFSELALLDETRDGWIDERDSAFEHLYLWTGRHAGSESLRSLKESGIGALYSGNIQTSFALRDPQHNLLGQIRRSGIFLEETGVAGSLQQLDLVT